MGKLLCEKNLRDVWCRNESVRAEIGPILQTHTDTRVSYNSIDGEVKQRQFFYHHGDTICHPRSGYVTTKLHGTSTCRCKNNAIFSNSNFHVSYRCCMPATLIWTPQSIAGGCQTSEMAALLNSLFFAFTNSFLPKYRVKYYDYIIKWCSGI